MGYSSPLEDERNFKIWKILTGIFSVVGGENMRKLTSANGLEELRLDRSVMAKLVRGGYSVYDVVVAARLGSLNNLDCIGPSSAERIFTAVDRAGFILHESTQSAAIRRLLSKTFQYEVTTTDEYERQAEFSEAQIQDAFKVLKTLKTREQEVIEMRCGLDGKGIRTLRVVGEVLNVTGERARSIEAGAFRKLRHVFRARHLMKIFPDFPGFPEELITELVEIEARRPIAGLDYLPGQINAVLREVKLDSVERLSALPVGDFIKMRDVLGKEGVDSLYQTLSNILTK